MPRKNNEQIASQIAEAMDEVMLSQSNPQKQLEIMFSLIKAGDFPPNVRTKHCAQQT